ncbi:protein lingerer isoform X3 [Atheta coriaria]|uniref:protein lingerer isoform X3 n=1 Tax=Dalotia coriaria TaxID=877792 RepID=UPI0031F3D604
MSSNNRATVKGGKGPKGDKAHKMDKSDSKGSGDKQHSVTSGSGDNKSDEEKISQVIEMTQKSEIQVCWALHECDFDMAQAIDMLLDMNSEDEWETSVKKRKNRQQSASKSDQKGDNAVTAASDDPWGDSTNAGTGDKDKPRNKTSGSQRFHGRHNDSRGWRGREKQENERNMEDGGMGGRERRGRPGGSTRGAGGARGRGGGRAGGRYPARSNRGGGTFNNRPMETWDNSWDGTTTTTANHTEENWGDEFPGADEWCGTLSETKVFTPSQPNEPTTDPEPSSGPTLESSSPLGSSVQQSMDMLAQMSGTQNAPVAMSGTLNAAQTQYFSQLTQQSSNHNEMGKFAPTAQQPPPANYGNNNAQYAAAAAQQQPPVVAANAYANATAYTNSYGQPEGAPVHQQPPTRSKVRAKIPPPSKIPATAVEMPGDLPNMGLLDLQFGAMDIMSDSSSFDGVVTEKYQNSTSILDSSAAPTMDLNSQQASATLDAYSPSKPSAQSSISSALTQSLSNSDSIPQTSEHLSSGYSASSAVSQRSSSAASANNAGGGNAGLDALGKQQPDAHAYSSQASSYSSYQSKSAANFPNQTYSSSTNYSGTQTTNSSYAPNPAANSYVNSDSAASYNSNNANSSSYQNTYSANASYQSNANQPPFPASISQGGGGAYPSNNQSYQQNASQSVYGTGNASLNSNSNYGGNSAQYNNYNSNHKLGKDGSGGGAYDAGTAVTSSLATTTSSTATSLGGISTATSSKTNTTLSKNSNSVVSNMPSSATPVMGQYIMGQVPYFQPPMYSYEEMQMLQQRIPHMTTPFYEMSYQTPATTLREGSYSLSDGRFARTDSNASPVSSTQTSTQPMLAAQTTGPYFFAPYTPMQPSYQFGAVYTSQLPTGTNAHGSNTTAQYPKPASYGSAYTSGYESLTQTQDYAKGGYVGNTQGASKGGAANATSGGNAANDLSMYGKSHTALGKVNQGFHSGTPPPFTGALGQSALAPSGTGYGPQMYIPTLPQHQHHSTQLMHQPLHQMDVRHHGRRMDSGNSTGQRAQSNNQQKAGSKQAYQGNSYWNQS